METTSKYSFRRAHIREELHSARVTLKGEMCIKEIQTILYEMYHQLHDQWHQTRFDPQYLFLSEKDHKTITDEIAKNACSWYMPNPDYEINDGLFNDLRSIPMSRFVNETTGMPMIIVVSPRLEDGKIIVAL